MAGTSTQPSNVSTEDTPPDRPQNVVTDETQTSAAGDDSQAAPDDESGRKADDAAPSDPDKAKPTRNRSAERKIARLTKKLAREQDARNQDRQRIESMERELAELKEGRQSKPAKKPDIKDFDTPEEYARAFATYEAAQKKGKSTGDGKGKGKRSDADPPARPRDEPEPPPEDDVKAFVTKGKEKLGDEFVEAYQNPKDVPVNPAMGDYMLDSDVGPELYVWLYNNPEEAMKIYRRSETGVVRKLDQLSKQIEKHGTWDFEEESGSAGKGKGSGDGVGKVDAREGSGKTRQESRAPDPPSEPDRGTVRHDVDLDAANMDDYAEARRRQIKKSGAPIL